MRRTRIAASALAATTATAVTAALLAPPGSASGAPPVFGAVTGSDTVSAQAGAPKKATSEGYGGAVSSVDPEATKIGLKVLKRGGNAVDAAVATAAALGLTEPFSAGIGGGGYFVVLQRREGEVQTLDGRETAPKAMPKRRLHRPGDGQAVSLHARPGDERRLRRCSRHPGDVGAGAGQVGHVVARR